MPSPVRLNSHQHASARDRLAPAEVFTAPSPEAQAQYAAQRAYAAYQEALAEMFRGRLRSVDVMTARVQWCMAESRLVAMRAHEAKSMEGVNE